MARICKLRPCGLPSKYEFVRVEGEGGFGKVLKCLNKDTLQVVAVKMPKRWTKHNKNEISILKMCHNLDKCNIVRYIECFQTICGKALVFESLDISLFEYIRLNKVEPMRLSDVRTIIQQMATALDALKGIGVTHADVKPENIMMVNHYRHPLQVKLIDFGLSYPTSQAEKYRGRQALPLISPEVFLGRKFDEAIDMWALGNVMLLMVSGCFPFMRRNRYETMWSIVELLGKPADQFLDKCQWATIYFTKTDEGVWRLKSPSEYYEYPSDEPRESLEIQCLDELKAMRLEKDNETEAVEREQCVELLKAMLAFDADERITPREVLTHPFITKVYPSFQTFSEDFECEPSSAPLDDEAIQPGDCTPSLQILPSGVILVRPAKAENTTRLEDEESTVSEPTAAPLWDEEFRNIQLEDCTPSLDILPSGVILVRPAKAENTTRLGDEESTVSELTAAPLWDEESSNIKPDDCTPSPELLLSGGILVQPYSSAENSTPLGVQEILLSFQSDSTVSNTDSYRKTSEDSTTCEDTGPKKKGEKKKNCFRRAVSWLRKTVSCCVPH